MEKEEFTRFVGRLVFEPETCSALSFSAEQWNDLCAQSQKAELSALFYFMLKDQLPEEIRPVFQKKYQAESMKRMIEEADLKNFYKLLEENRFPFMPIKGADLAFRIFPNPALRPHGDWDILFRKEDCPHVIKLLYKHGWQTFSGYEPEPPSHYHYERMHNKRQSIEVHWTLPNFGTATEEEIQAETESVDEFYHVLTPEMNLLLISAHASAWEYMHLSKWKILMDAGFILKRHAVDWGKVHAFADRWGLLRPDILFSAWSEFFPEGMLPAESLNPEWQQLIRETFELGERMKKRSSYARRSAACKHFSLQWVRAQLKFYNPASICLKYHLKPHQKLRIFSCGLRDFIGKAFFFLRYSGAKDPELQRYYQNVEQFRKLVKHEEK